MQVELRVSGFIDIFNFSDDEVKRVHLPILRKINSLIGTSRERVVVLLAGPPGSGKSTTAALWEFLSLNDPSLEMVQHLSIDGFHFPNTFLDANTCMQDGKSISLKEIKGAPETYNVEALKKAVHQLKSKDVLWPEYDRKLHDPVENKILVTAAAVIIEGNWVLFNQSPWDSLAELADVTIFIEADEQILKQRLIQRKLRGRYSDDFVQEHYRKADKPNINLVMNDSCRADTVLELEEMNNLSLKRLL
jgi:putative kinase